MRNSVCTCITKIWPHCLYLNLCDLDKNETDTTTKQKIKHKKPCRTRELNPGPLASKAHALPLHQRVN